MIKNSELLQKELLQLKLSNKNLEKQIFLHEETISVLTEEIITANTNLAIVLQQDVEDFRNVFDTIVDSYILMDLNGNVLKMNQPAIDFFGYDIKNETFNVTEIIYEEDIEYAYKSFYQLHEEGAFQDFQARVYTKEKEVKWVQINSSLIKDKDGSIVFAHGIVRDITEAKNLQEEFDNQKQQLSAIVENSSLGIVLSKKNTIIKTNSAFQKMLGFSEEELLQKTILDISYKEDKVSSKEKMTMLENNKINDFVIKKRYTKKDGGLIWAKTSVSIVKNEDDAQEYQVAVIEDISDEHKRQGILKALNSLMVSVLGKNNIHEIAWDVVNTITGLLNFEDCVVYLIDKENKRMSQIAAFGKDVDKDNVLISPVDIEVGYGIAGFVAKSGKSEIIKDTSKDKRYFVDGISRLSEICVPIITDGEVIGIIDSEHPERDFFTKDHLNMLQSIAGLVASQLKSAYNLKQKIEAEKKTEILLEDLTKTNNDLNDFAHVVSHDLKSPLRSMNALVSWLEEDCEDFLNDDLRNNFKQVHERIDKMDMLINGILNYASIDKIEKKERNINLEILLNDILETIYFPENIEIIIKNKLPILKGDNYRLHQLFQNLISNAVKYTNEENGIVEIDCISIGDFWQFSIKDNGKGIDEKYHEKIFQIFQSLEEPNVENSGVGLSIVKKIVDFYKGKIWVESQVKLGSTFFFTLPK
ncbi:PAS domain S-box-containing protein [Lutibacter sp. Hel_I_33_5]|uniref:PAS domain-containing sensor histidine kinase n=1 Tax=Lutibacter sp. Hel_I_33_5 TaxID=1566289 RepID=UPI0011A0E4C0|nr:PAS domain S-box protein [Lutibacter sp. Hel_I_33_5]TVZ55583.1 PAS domain S-box-containing protein [Lutibacter sp. Hel_I_33_5]